VKFRILFSISLHVFAYLFLKAQVVSFPYYEYFDSVTAPALPAGWSADGFTINASAFRSSPYCISATGNMTPKSVISQSFDFTNRFPEKLIFWERRSGTAASYRVEMLASMDGTTFNIFLARFDTISSASGYVQRIIDLKGSGLQNQPSVRFKWLLISDNTNTTGVLRIDDVSLTITTGLDIGAISMAVFPINASEKDTLNLTVNVKNYGSMAASNFSVQFFTDIDRDGFAESNELLSVVSGLVLEPGDSLTCQTFHLPMTVGEYCFIAVINFSQDEKRLNDTISTIANIRCKQGDVLVNEIMYAPEGDEQEWIELYNNSPDSINLKNWKISDSNISTKSVITQSDRFILPGSYLVIAKDVTYPVMHPGIVSIVTNFSALNNFTPDAVIIYDGLSRSIDSVMYQPNWGGQRGKSLERIDVYSLSTSAANWGSCRDSSGCTPGKINSIARLDYDLAIGNLAQTWIVSAGKTLPVINTTVRNIGRKPIDSIIICYYADRNHDKCPEISELLLSIISTQRIFAGDSVQISESLPQIASGEIQLLVVIENWKDERVKNNIDTITIKIGYEPRSLIINELMYDPLEGQNEWLELFNRSNQPIDLANWTFNDKATLSNVNSFTISNSSMIIQPGGFAVVAADSAICNIFTNLRSSHSGISLSILNRSGGFSFNNDGDAVVMKDLTGQSIDSVAYLPRWHHPDVVDTRGRSLERINPDLATNDPRNWSTCTNTEGGTPGKVNSILTANASSNSAISISPNPFSPDGDGFEDYCIIHYNFQMSASILNIRIYDIKGRCIRTLANCEFVGAKGEIIWDGFDDSRQRARIGVYVIYAEATDRSSSRVEHVKAVAVVAAKL
jgi:hypothetical protein